jgi:hypothetical protein
MVGTLSVRPGDNLMSLRLLRTSGLAALVGAGLLLLPEQASAQLFSAPSNLGTAAVGTGFGTFGSGFGIANNGLGVVPIGNGLGAVPVGPGLGVLPGGNVFPNLGFGFGPFFRMGSGLGFATIANTLTGELFPFNTNQAVQMNRSRFFDYTLITGGGVLNGPVPIARRFAGLGGQFYNTFGGPGFRGCGCLGGMGSALGGFPGGGFAWQNQFNSGLLPAGVQVNVGYNTVLGIQQPPPGIGRFPGYSFFRPGGNPFGAGPGCWPGKFGFGNGRYGL